MGTPFEEARPFNFTSNGDNYGWNPTPDGRHHRTVFIRSGRLDLKLLDALRDIARIPLGTFRLTPNQNVLIAGVRPVERASIDTLLVDSGLDQDQDSPFRRKRIGVCEWETR